MLARNCSALAFLLRPVSSRKNLVKYPHVDRRRPRVGKHLGHDRIAKDGAILVPDVKHVIWPLPSNTLKGPAIPPLCDCSELEVHT